MALGLPPCGDAGHDHGNYHAPQIQYHAPQIQYNTPQIHHEPIHISAPQIQTLQTVHFQPKPLQLAPIQTAHFTPNHIQPIVRPNIQYSVSADLSYQGHGHSLKKEQGYHVTAGLSNFGGGSSYKFSAPVQHTYTTKLTSVPLATYSSGHSSFSGYSYKKPEKITKVSITPSISYSLDSQKEYAHDHSYSSGISSQSFSSGYDYPKPTIKLEHEPAHLVKTQHVQLAPIQTHVQTKYVAPIIKQYEPALTKFVLPAIQSHGHQQTSYAPQHINLGHQQAYSHQVYTQQKSTYDHQENHGHHNSQQLNLGYAAGNLGHSTQLNLGYASGHNLGHGHGGEYTIFTTPVGKSEHKGEHKPIKIKHSEYYVS